MRIYTKVHLILLQTKNAVIKKPFNIEPDIKRLEYAKKFIAQIQIQLKQETCQNIFVPVILVNASMIA